MWLLKPVFVSLCVSQRDFVRLSLIERDDFSIYIYGGGHFGCCNLIFARNLLTFRCSHKPKCKSVPHLLEKLSCSQPMDEVRDSISNYLLCSKMEDNKPACQNLLICFSKHLDGCISFHLLSPLFNPLKMLKLFLSLFWASFCSASEEKTWMTMASVQAKFSINSSN